MRNYIIICFLVMCKFSLLSGVVMDQENYNTNEVPETTEAVTENETSTSLYDYIMNSKFGCACFGLGSIIALLIFMVNSPDKEESAEDSDA